MLNILNRLQLLIISFIFVFHFNINAQNSAKVYSDTFGMMGTFFEIKIVSNNPANAHLALKKAKKEIARIEALISSWNPNSQTSEINQNAGIKPIKVDLELYFLIERSKNVSKLTKGAFDISSQALMEIWRFDGSMITLPPKNKIRKITSKVNFKKIFLSPKDTTVFLKKRGMKIGFGAVGKGYAAHKIKDLLIKLGFENGIVNAGGDLTAWGISEKGKAWKIGIASPNRNEEFAKILSVKDKAVVTSGNSEKYFMFERKRYSHIINPKSGLPVRGLKSVTIIHSNAELADALATGVFVLGLKKGSRILKKIDNIGWIIIDDSNKIFQSKNHFLK